jgi:cadmium resistance protein CadD (predicted permease)
MFASCTSIVISFILETQQPLSRATNTNTNVALTIFFMLALILVFISKSIAQRKCLNQTKEFIPE